MHIAEAFVDKICQDNYAENDEEEANNDVSKNQFSTKNGM